MSSPLIPQGYDVAKAVQASHSHCQITVGFDRHQHHVRCFLVQLHYLPPAEPSWTEIARFDHNETSASGHDVYRDGLHIDVADETGSTTKIRPSHGGLPQNRGTVIRSCVDYLDDHAHYFIDVYQGDIAPGSPPGWPDGGEQPHTLFPASTLAGDMRRDVEPEEPLSREELTELLGEVTGVAPEDINRQAEEFEIGPPEEADVVGE